MKMNTLREEIENRFEKEGFEGEEFAGIAESCEHAYKLGLNPLPKLRDMLKGLPLDVSFAFFGNGGTFFDADKRSGTLGVFLHDEGWVTITLFDTYLSDGRWFEVWPDADLDITMK